MRVAVLWTSVFENVVNQMLNKRLLSNVLLALGQVVKKLKFGRRTSKRLFNEKYTEVTEFAFCRWSKFKVNEEQCRECGARVAYNRLASVKKSVLQRWTSKFNKVSERQEKDGHPLCNQTNIIPLICALSKSSSEIRCSSSKPSLAHISSLQLSPDLFLSTTLPSAPAPSTSATWPVQGERAKRASLLEDKYTRDEVRKIASDGYIHY